MSNTQDTASSSDDTGIYQIPPLPFGVSVDWYSNRRGSGGQLRYYTDVTIHHSQGDKSSPTATQKPSLTADSALDVVSWVQNTCFGDPGRVNSKEAANIWLKRAAQEWETHHDDISKANDKQNLSARGDVATYHQVTAEDEVATGDGVITEEGVECSRAQWAEGRSAERGHWINDSDFIIVTFRPSVSGLEKGPYLRRRIKSVPLSGDSRF